MTRGHGYGWQPRLPSSLLLIHLFLRLEKVFCAGKEVGPAELTTIPGSLDINRSSL